MKVSVKFDNGLMLKSIKDRMEVLLPDGTHTLKKIPNPYHEPGEKGFSSYWYVLKDMPEFGRPISWWNGHRGEKTFMVLPSLE